MRLRDLGVTLHLLFQSILEVQSNQLSLKKITKAVIEKLKEAKQERTSKVRSSPNSSDSLKILLRTQERLFVM